jgi:hypothetical protein
LPLARHDDYWLKALLGVRLSNLYMSKKTRNTFFIILIFLFLAIAPAMVMYCLGWRVDWGSWKVIEPGMLYFRATPKSAEVYIEGKPEKKTDIFFGSILIEDLMPRNYNIEIKKAGYHTWTKTLAVDKRQVTEAKNITLIPENINLTQISANLEKVFYSQDYSKIIAQEFTEDTKTKTKKWNLKLINTSNNLKSHLVSQDDFKLGSTIDLQDIIIANNTKRTIIKVISKDQLLYFLLDLSTSVLTQINPKEEIDDIYFNPSDEGKIFLLVPSTKKNTKPEDLFYDLKAMDLKTKEISPALFTNLVALNVSGDNAYILDSAGFVYKSNLLISSMDKLNVIPFSVKSETEYKLSVLEDLIFLKESASLYILNKDTLSFEKLMDSIKGFSLSPDSKQLAYFNDNEVHILFLEKKLEQPHKEKGVDLLLESFPDGINNVYWFNNFYLILASKNKVKIIETDDRSKLNIVDAVKIENPDIVWANNKLLIFSNKTLSVSTDLTP